MTYRHYLTFQNICNFLVIIFFIICHINCYCCGVLKSSDTHISDLSESLSA